MLYSPSGSSDCILEILFGNKYSLQNDYSGDFEIERCIGVESQSKAKRCII